MDGAAVPENVGKEGIEMTNVAPPVATPQAKGMVYEKNRVGYASYREGFAAQTYALFLKVLHAQPPLWNDRRSHN
jgi:hypothetical protein